MPKDLFDQAASRVLVLGIGSTGTRLAALGAAEAAGGDGLHALYAALHSDPAELIASGLEHKLHVPIAAGPFAAQSAETALAACAAKIDVWTKGKHLAVLAGALGDPCAGVLLPLAARALAHKDIFVSVIAAEPMEGDGVSKMERALAAVEEIQAESDLVVVVPGQAVNTGIPIDVPLGEARARADRMLWLAADVCASALACGLDGAGFTRAALQGRLGGNGAIHSMLGVARGPDAPLAAAEDALRSLAGDEGLSEKAGFAAAVLSGSELSVSQAQVLADRLHETLHPRQPVLLSFAVQAHLGDEACCLLLWRTVGSPKVIALAEARA